MGRLGLQYIKRWIREELWDHVPVSIAVINRDFHVVEANRTFSRSYGKWRGRACYAVYKGRAERCDDCPAAETFLDGEVRVREEQGAQRNGKPSYYLVRFVPVVRENGDMPYVVEMSTDITPMKMLEQEKLEAERLAAVGQTVAGLAHGIKNVLMGLEGGVYVVRSGMQKADSQRILRGWQIVEENISRITTFVKEFLDFAKGRSPKVVLMNPNDVVVRVVDLFRDAASLAGIDLRHDLASGVAPAHMDEEEVHTCLANLVSNALDACQASDRPGGHVIVSTREQDGTLVFEVADDGMGMEAEIQRNVFTNFFSTKGSDKGTGLGLLTTRKIVQQHGGNVSFTSAEGLGSVFRIEFPRNRLPHPTEGQEQPRS